VDYIDIYDEKVEGDEGWIAFETAADRSYTKRTEGDYIAKGPINLPVDAKNIGWLLKWALGSVSTGAKQGNGTYTHTFKCADDLKSFTGRIGVADFTNMERILAGMLVDTLSLKSEFRKALDASVGVVSFLKETKGSIGTPSFSALNPFMFAQGVVKIATATVGYAHGIALNLNNKIPVDKWFNKIHVGKRTVDGTLTLVFDEATEYDRFLAGTEFALEQTFTGALIEAGFYNTLKLSLPHCNYTKDTAPHINKREMCMINAPFQAFYDATDTELKIELTNATVGYPAPES
jgi:hypothetical protein